MEEQEESTVKSLFRAVEENNVDIVREILRGNSSVVNERNYLGYTPLMVAAMYGNLEIMKILVSMGADMKLCSRTYIGDIDSCTTLHLAVRHNKPEITKYILSQTHTLLNSKNRYGETPLFLALHYGNVEMLKHLVYSGANIFVRDMEGLTFLHRAARCGKLENFMYALDKNKEALNAVDMEGSTPLLTLIWWHWDEGKERAVDAILEAGADFTIKDKKGNSPTRVAARTRQLGVVVRLLKMGSGLSWIGQDAQTEILCLLAEIGEPCAKKKKKYSIFDPPGYKCRVEEAIENILQAAGITQNFRDESGSIMPGAAEKQIVDALLSTGLNINARGMNGDTPLAEALKGGNINLIMAILAAGADVKIPCYSDTPIVTQHLHNRKILELLISAGADVNALDGWGNPPLHRALYLKSLEVVDLLVTSGADVNFTSDRGDPLLLTAIQYGNVKIAEYFIQKGADVNSVGHYEKETPLHVAVQRLNPEFVEYLIKAGAKVNCAREDGYTPLHVAAKRGCMQCVEMLLNAGATVDALTKNGKTPFHVAAESGVLKIMKLLYHNGANKAVRDQNGETPLHYAAKCGNLTAFEYLLELGLDPCLKDDNGNTLLHMAVKGGQLLITNAILEKKLLPVDEQNIIGQTPLMVAADSTFMEILLHSGASTDIMDNEGKTAFHLAAVKGNVMMLKSLASAGTSITAKDKSNRTALHWAAEGVHIEALEYLLQLYLLSQLSEDINALEITDQSTRKTSDLKATKHLDCVNDKDDTGLTPFMLVVQTGYLREKYEKALQLLLDHGSDIKASDYKQKTALHLAIDKADFQVIKTLLSLGSDIKDLDYEYLNTALRIAAKCGHCELVEQLILAGAEPMSRDPATNSTPLHLASIAGDKKTVEYLLSLNVPVEERDSEGCTALHCAAECACVGVVKCLLEKGHAEVDARDNEGMTPLMRAVSGWREECRREDLLDILQLAGTDFHAQNLDGKTALQIAATHGHPNVYKRLKVLIYASDTNNI